MREVMRNPLWFILALMIAGACDRPKEGESYILEPTLGASADEEDWTPTAASSDISAGNAVAGASDDEYRASLLRRREEIRGQLEALPQEAELLARTRMERELALVQERLDDVARAFVEQQRRIKLAKASLELFLRRAESEAWWEIDYGLRSGELSLVRSIVQDNLLRVERDTEDTGLDAHEVRRLAAQSFLKLAAVALSATDFQEADRNLRLAAEYSADLAVSIDALSERAELLRSLGMEEKAGELDQQRQELLLRAAP